MSEFRKIDETLDNPELVCTKADGTKYNFNIFALQKGFINNVIALIERESKDINNDLFKKYFKFSAPIDLAKKLFETKDQMKNWVCKKNQE